MLYIFFKVLSTFNIYFNISFYLWLNWLIGLLLSIFQYFFNFLYFSLSLLNNSTLKSLNAHSPYLITWYLSATICAWNILLFITLINSLNIFITTTCGCISNSFIIFFIVCECLFLSISTSLRFSSYIASWYFSFSIFSLNIYIYLWRIYL